jgi:hypothetical protein
LLRVEPSNLNITSRREVATYWYRDILRRMGISTRLRNIYNSYQVLSG